MTKGKATKSRRRYLLLHCANRQWKKLYEFPSCYEAEEEMNKYPLGRFRIMREYTVRELVKEKTGEPKAFKPPGPQANRRRFHR